MTNNDLKQIGKLLDEKLTATEKGLTAIFDEKLTATEKKLTASIKTELTASINEKLAATEKRLKAHTAASITESENNIIEEIAGFMEVNILPKLNGKANKSDIDRIERRLDSNADKIGEHDVRLKHIESFPIIAHQLKIKKVK